MNVVHVLFCAPHSEKGEDKALTVNACGHSEGAHIVLHCINWSFLVVAKRRHNSKIEFEFNLNSILNIIGCFGIALVPFVFRCSIIFFSVECHHRFISFTRDDVGRSVGLPNSDDRKDRRKFHLTCPWKCNRHGIFILCHFSSLSISALLAHATRRVDGSAYASYLVHKSIVAA